MSDESALVRVRGLDHVVLVVGDVQATLDWYVRILGLAPERVGAWERGEVFFPSVRIDEATVIDLLPRADGVDRPAAGNVDHLCLVVDADLDALAASGAFDVVSGPSELWGARGMGRGLYVRDPDGNTVELRTYA